MKETTYHAAVAIKNLCWTIRDTLHERVQAARHDKRGEVSSTVITIAILAALAIAAGAIITQKITSKASSIPTE